MCVCRILCVTAVQNGTSGLEQPVNSEPMALQSAALKLPL